MPRIVITGSHGVGKTTLGERVVRALQAQQIAAVLAPEPIRVVKPLTAGQTPAEHRLRMLTEHFRRLALGRDSVCIYDRSLLDMLVYGRLKQPQPDVMEELLLELLHWYRSFIDLFLFIPIEFELPPNPAVPYIASTRAPLEQALRSAAQQAGIVLTEIRGDVAERTRQTLMQIRTVTGLTIDPDRVGF